MITIALGPITTSSSFTYYMGLPVTCRLVKATAATTTAVTNADTTVTFSDGTTDIGTVTVGYSGSAAGDTDQMTLDTTSLGDVKIDADTPLKIVGDGGGDAGAVILTLTFSEFT